MDNTIESFWSGPIWNIPGTPWEIIGYSRACYRTGFYIRHLDLMIDAGPQKSGNPKTILITHCHADHIANVPFTLIEMDPAGGRVSSLPDIFVHEKSKTRLHNYIAAMFSANYATDFKGSVANYIPVKGSDVLDYTANNTKIRIEVFACTHDVPTVAYGISTKKQRLKEEYFDLKGNAKALVELKKKGIEITETSYEPNIAFIWDTTIHIFRSNPGILKYPVIMIECTFLYDDDYEQSLTKKHIHWKSLRPHVVNNPDTIFVLIHFSLRYTEQEIAAFFKKEGLANVKPWLQI
jgi:ribonuclease Z